MNVTLEGMIAAVKTARGGYIIIVDEVEYYELSYSELTPAQQALAVVCPNPICRAEIGKSCKYPDGTECSPCPTRIALVSSGKYDFHNLTKRLEASGVYDRGGAEGPIATAVPESTERECEKDVKRVWPDANCRRIVMVDKYGMQTGELRYLIGTQHPKDLSDLCDSEPEAWHSAAQRPEVIAARMRESIETSAKEVASWSSAKREAADVTSPEFNPPSRYAEVVAARQEERLHCERIQRTHEPFTTLPDPASPERGESKEFDLKYKLQAQYALGFNAGEVSGFNDCRERQLLSALEEARVQKELVIELEKNLKFECEKYHKNLESAEAKVAEFGKKISGTDTVGGPLQIALLIEQEKDSEHISALESAVRELAKAAGKAVGHGANDYINPILHALYNPVVQELTKGEKSL